MAKRQIRPLQRNPNRHTQRGLCELEKSVREDGWVAPITVAADGESLDGAARLEVAADVMGGIEPLIVEHDGQRPIIMVRTDIPNAETPEARRIAYRANRVAELDLDWDADVLAADVEAGLDLTGLWEEWEQRMINLQVHGPDEFKEFDEGAAADVEMVTCPNCGHTFPK